jgi:hypothetical protein
MWVPHEGIDFLEMRESVARLLYVFLSIRDEFQVTRYALRIR